MGAKFCVTDIQNVYKVCQNMGYILCISILIYKTSTQ